MTKLSATAKKNEEKKTDLSMVKPEAKASAAPAAKPTEKAKKPAAKKATAKKAEKPAETAAVEPTGPTQEEQDKAAAFFQQATAEQKGGTKAKKVEKTAAAPKAEKPQKVVVSFVPRTAAKGAVLHAIEETARPTSGTRLFAHTHAALTVLNLLSPERPAIPEKIVLAVMGQRAVSYHTKQTLNMERGPDHTLRLTASGYNFFRGRMIDGKVDGGLANDFVALFMDGKAAASTGVSDGKVYAAVKL